MELLGFSFDIFLFSFVKRKIERQENYELVLQSNSQTTLLKINAFLNFIKIGNYIFIIEKILFNYLYFIKKINYKWMKIM